MFPDNVKKVFNEILWCIATCGDEPNVVPVGFKLYVMTGEAYQIKGTAELVYDG